MAELKRNSGPNALRRGRVSIPHANYFVTVCLDPRKPILVAALAQILLTEAHRMVAESIWATRAMTVMPDHVHVLFTLGERLALSQAIARFKFSTRAMLRAENTGWQTNFFDHRLRPDDPVEAVIRYIYQNPYRAGLISEDKTWPNFYCCAADWDWFKNLTCSGLPYPEWLG